MSSLPFSFGAPWYLLLLLLLPVIFWVARNSLAGLGGSRRFFALTLRVVVFLLLVLALSEFRFLKKNDRLAVIFVLDRSESIPAAKKEAARRFVIAKALERDYENEDLVGVVTFGTKAGIEWIPKKDDLDIESFLTLIEPEGTDIAAGIRLATAAFPHGVNKRIVLLSDGNQNRGNILEETRNARAQGITVDVIPITYSYPREITVEKVLVDTEVHQGAPFDVRVVVNSTHEAEVNLRLFQGDERVSAQDTVRKLHPGPNVFEFRGLRVERSGLFVYEARLDPVDEADDALPQNNSASEFTVVSGEPKVLFCATNPDEDHAFVEALRTERVEVEVTSPAYLPQRPEEYRAYDTIVLSNVAAHQLSDRTMELFEVLVKSLGVGFVMIGGEDSFGAGGYQGTPIERLLPVEMEIKHRKILPNGALAMVVHSCELANGNWWANQVIRRALQILSPRDYAGVISYDRGQDTWLFPMSPVAQRQSMLAKLNGFNSGDMPSFQNIMRMALAGLTKTPASIKHMIVLTDGDPSPPPAALVQAIRAQRITISVICYGAHGGIPPGIRDLARTGGGQFHYLRSGQDLPEVFIREAVTVTKSLISEETFQPQVVGASPILQGIDALPPLDGYVLATPKSRANIVLAHPPKANDPAQDPILATWAYGVGKSVAFTSDAGRRWGKKWIDSPVYRSFWTQCVRWVMRSQSNDRFRVTRTVEGGEGVITIDALTPNGEFVDGIDFSGAVVAPDLKPRDVVVRQVAPGQYRARFPVEQQGSYAVALGYEDESGATVRLDSGLNVPYSPEFRRLNTDHELLQRVAETSGGRYFEELAKADFFSRDFPVTRDVLDIWLDLLFAAVFLFFADVFVRRVAIDYREAAVKAWHSMLAVVGRGQRTLAPADGRLATLLERKAELRQESEKRYRPGERLGSEGASSRPAATWDSTAMPEPGARPARQASGSGKSPGAPSDGGAATTGAGSAYTARLLEAKKRARQRGAGNKGNREDVDQHDEQ